MRYSDYANAITAAPGERKRLLKRARQDPGISVAEYIKLENLVDALERPKWRQKP